MPNQNSGSVGGSDWGTEEMEKQLEALSLGPSNKTEPAGRKMVNGDLVDSAPPRPAHKIAPMVRPRRPPNMQRINFANPSASSMMFNPGMRRRPPSPVRAGPKLELTPSGPLGDTELFDPKSSAWSQPVNIQEMRRAISEQARQPIDEVHSKPKFNPHGPVTPTAQKTEQLTAAEQVKLMNEIIDDGVIARETSTEPLVVEGLVPNLMDHQVAGVRFMIKREKKTSNCGGFLCDEMGLGKTVQSIALILSNPQKDASGPKTTLVIAPLSLLEQWKAEITEKAPKLKVLLFYGPNRRSNFEDYDVVLTTYTLCTYGFGDKPESRGPLFKFKWYRIIADEAHTIRNHNTKSSQALACLDSDGNRWALTGTPICNSLNDIFSLLRFIGVKPHGNWEVWTRDIGLPLMSSKYSASPREIQRAKKIVVTYLSAMMLRRRQNILAHVLPEKQSEIVRIVLNEQERDEYQVIVKNGASDISALTMLVRMRLACDNIHNYKYVPKDADEKYLDKFMAPPTSEISGSSDKSLKIEKQSYDYGDSDSDDLDELSVALGKTSLESDEPGRNPHEGSKITKLREILNQDRSRKTVLFTSYVMYFSQITEMLEDEGLSYCLYYGALSSKDRAAALQQFRDREDKHVLICSLQCAAVGLNIVCASRVVIMEPWWNPMISDQAINRVYRLGQRRKVNVYEFMVEDSLEERIFEIQNRKRRLVNDVVEAKSSSLSKDEMQYIIWGRRGPPA